METLHTILLGPYKYLLRTLMGHLTSAQKDDLQARLVIFDFSGLDYKMSYNLTCHYRSFVGTCRVCTCLYSQHITADLFYIGRDFKALAQVSLFLLGPYMPPEEKAVWLALVRVRTCVCVRNCSK